MIPCSDTRVESESWQREMASSFTELDDFIDFLGLEVADREGLRQAASAFPFRVTRFYAGLMEKRNPRDPLLLQVLPAVAETRPAPGFSRDPLGDLDASQGAGLLQKYQGRALLIASGTCAINCRYCFRRHFPYAAHSAAGRDREHALSLLRARPDITEAILSGGDPLTLSNRRLRELLSGLCRIPHLRRLRIHTRLPVVLPGRIDRNLVDLLGSLAPATSLVLHVNHPREVTPELETAMNALRGTGTTLFNQAVLLRGINDDFAVQRDLCESLYDIGVLPYYLHLLDRVTGTSHFEVPRADAVHLLRRLQGSLPGYLVPRLVFEEPGAANKLPV